MSSVSCFSCAWRAPSASRRFTRWDPQKAIASLTWLFDQFFACAVCRNSSIKGLSASPMTTPSGACTLYSSALAGMPCSTRHAAFCSSVPLSGNGVTALNSPEDTLLRSEW